MVRLISRWTYGNIEVWTDKEYNDGLYETNNPILKGWMSQEIYEVIKRTRGRKAYELWYGSEMMGSWRDW